MRGPLAVRPSGPPAASWPSYATCRRSWTTHRPPAAAPLELGAGGAWAAMPKPLTINALKSQAKQFARRESRQTHQSLFGVTDGKAIGTHIESRFRDHLRSNYTFEAGSSAGGLDFPHLNVDMKATSLRQPQSSCPFRSARQKIYGLGYHLLVFVYDKSDDLNSRSSRLDIRHTVYVDESRTADYQTTRGLLSLIERDANIDDILAFFHERLLPVEEIAAEALAKEVLEQAPELGYLTISNALQWRLQYRRAISEAGNVEGIDAL